MKRWQKYLLITIILKSLVLRFFTVYGPWGRPDLVIIKLVNAYFKNTKFYLNNYGKHKRDFTYILDVVDVIDKLSRIKFKTNHNIFNIMFIQAH